MEGIDKYAHLNSREARNQGIRDMLYQILIDGQKVTDKNSRYFSENRINQPNGIFQLEFGEVTNDTVSVYHTISNELEHIQPWDTVVRIHVKPKTEFTNPNNKSSRELMSDGMKRVRDEVLKLPINKRPKYFISYSHITNKLGQKYNFKKYNIPNHIKKEGWSGFFFEPKNQEKLKKAIESNEEVLEIETDLKETEKLKYEIAKYKSQLLIPEKYSFDDIKLIVEPIENLLNITDEYFEQLKKPSS